MNETKKLQDASIADMQRVIHANNVDKGWWDEDRPFSEVAMLVVTEIAEAVEAWRDHEPLFRTGDNGKPEGVAVEMADAAIRIFDWAEVAGVDLGAIIAIKHAYNTTRPYRHGGKRA